MWDGHPSQDWDFASFVVLEGALGRTIDACILKRSCKDTKKSARLLYDRLKIIR